MLHAYSMRRPTCPTLAVLAFAAQACNQTEPAVELAAAVDPGQPIADLEITLLPFDAQRLLDSLARVARVPEPSFGELETAVEAYRPPNEELLMAAAEPWRALRDSLTQLADSLNSIARGSAEYAHLFRRFRRMQPRLAPLATQRDSAVAALIAEHRDLADRATTAAASLRKWERVAYAAYEDLARAAAERSGRNAVTIRADSAGSAHLELAPGTWWAVARWPDPENPFLEYSWNVEFSVTGWLALRIPMTRENARHRWRH